MNVRQFDVFWEGNWDGRARVADDLLQDGLQSTPKWWEFRELDPNKHQIKKLSFFSKSKGGRKVIFYVTCIDLSK
jgi:hypothetical protein